MKKFICSTALFLLPLLVLLLPPVFALYTSAENFRDIDGLVDSEERYLIGYAYNESNYKYLKWRRLSGSIDSDVVMLGSSRVLAFRANLFQTSFYNAGYTISRIRDFIPFLESLPAENYPTYLIIGLDQWMFNENWDNFTKVRTEDYWRSSFQYRADFSTLMDAWNDLLRGKITLDYTDEGETTYIGLNARVNKKGFRNDGSMFYGTQIDKLLANDPSANDFGFSNTLQRIKHGNKRFQYGHVVNPAAIAELDRILRYCKEKGVFVVGFLPPFAQRVSEAMDETGEYDYIEKIYPESKIVFEQYGFELFDFTRSDRFGAEDSEAIDGFHLGEVAYLKLLKEMLESGSILNAVANVEELEHDYQQKVNRYVLYTD